MEDMYTFYVLILKIGEDVFWNNDIKFINKVAMNKLAYDAWSNNPREKGGR